MNLFNGWLILRKYPEIVRTAIAEEERRLESLRQQHRPLDLCEKHKPDGSSGGTYAEHNCDHCRALREIYRLDEEFSRMRNSAYKSDELVKELTETLSHVKEASHHKSLLIGTLYGKIGELEKRRWFKKRVHKAKDKPNTPNPKPYKVECRKCNDTGLSDNQHDWHCQCAKGQFLEQKGFIYHGK